MFGDKLKELRKQYGLSQEELGRRIGVTKQSVSRYEAGRMPTVEVMMRISEEFGVPFESLVKDYDWSSVTVFEDESDGEIVRQIVGRQTVPVLIPETKVKLHQIIDQISPDQAETVLRMLQGLLPEQRK